VADEVTAYVIDACALIAYFRGETGNDRFRALLKEDNNRFFMHSVNVGEVYYDTLRISGVEKAGEVFEDIAKLPIHVVWTLDIPFIELVGKHKTSYRISYADSFVLALSEREDAIVISTDHHEFDVIEDAGILAFSWLR